MTNKKQKAKSKPKENDMGRSLPATKRKGAEANTTPPPKKRRTTRASSPKSQANASTPPMKAFKLPDSDDDEIPPGDDYEEPLDDDEEDDANTAPSSSLLNYSIVGPLSASKLSKKQAANFSPSTPTPNRKFTGTISPKSPKRTPKKPSRVALFPRPNVHRLVEFLDDSEGGSLLVNAADFSDYLNRLPFYHSRLSLLLRGLNANELDVLFNTSQPRFFGGLTAQQKQELKDKFDAAYNVVEADLMRSCICGAEQWLASPAGGEYKAAYFKAKSGKRKGLKLPEKPCAPADLNLYMKHRGTVVSEAGMMTIWAHALAACEVTFFPEKPLKVWFTSDDSRLIFFALWQVTCSLYVRTAAILVTVIDHQLHTNAIRRVLRSVLTCELPPTSQFSSSLPFLCAATIDHPTALQKVVSAIEGNNLQYPVRLAPTHTTARQSADRNTEMRMALPKIAVEAKAKEQDAKYRHAAKLSDLLQEADLHNALGKHDLLSLAPYVPCEEEEQEDVAAEFAKGSWRVRLGILEQGIRIEQVKIDALAWAQYDRIREMKEEQTRLLELEAKRIQTCKLFSQARREAEALESENTAIRSRIASKSVVDYAESFSTPFSGSAQASGPAQTPRSAQLPGSVQHSHRIVAGTSRYSKQSSPAKSHPHFQLSLTKRISVAETRAPFQPQPGKEISTVENRLLFQSQPVGGCSTPEDHSSPAENRPSFHFRPAKKITPTEHRPFVETQSGKKVSPAENPLTQPKATGKVSPVGNHPLAHLKTTEHPLVEPNTPVNADCAITGSFNTDSPLQFSDNFNPEAINKTSGAGAKDQTLNSDPSSGIPANPPQSEFDNAMTISSNEDKDVEYEGEDREDEEGGSENQSNHLAAFYAQG